MGVNAVRLAHYPQATYMYDLMDKYGIVTWAEIPCLLYTSHEIKELDYNVSAREFPKAPEAPQKEQLSEPTEYEQAVQTFE